MKLLPILYAAGWLALSIGAQAGEVVFASGFEDNDSPWNDPYVPSDSLDRGCSFDISSEEPHSGLRCGVLASDNSGRIAISPKGSPYHVEPGQRYKLTFWVKAGKEFEAQKGQPGMLVRIDLMQDRDPVSIVTVDWKGTTKIVQADETLADFTTLPVPPHWTKVEAEFTIPENVNKARPGLFLWRATGSLEVDDFRLERVRG